MGEAAEEITKELLSVQIPQRTSIIYLTPLHRAFVVALHLDNICHSKRIIFSKGSQPYIPLLNKVTTH